MGGLRLQLPDPGVEGDRAKIVVVLQRGYRIKSAFDTYNLKVPDRLLSSRPETWGLHPVGALARPHEESKRIKEKRKAKKTYADG